MLVEWVNHASFVVESGTVNLICDPWLDGTAFNHGWRLISPTIFRYEDFARVTHIWFSHEHPDHFSPSNLKRIPEQFRRNVTVGWAILRIVPRTRGMPSGNGLRCDGTSRCLSRRPSYRSPVSSIFPTKRTSS